MNNSTTLEPTLKGYALWLIPAKPEHYLLRNIIVELAKENHTPIFDPHITLLGEIEGNKDFVMEKTELLAKTIKPVEIELIGVNYLDEYYKCLFFTVKKSKELIEVYNKTGEVFQNHDLPDFMPHLSLIYGNLPEYKKQEMMNSVCKLLPLKFTVTCLRLCSINGKVKEWYKVKDFIIL